MSTSPTATRPGYDEDGQPDFLWHGETQTIVLSRDWETALRDDWTPKPMTTTVKVFTFGPSVPVVELDDGTTADGQMELTPAEARALATALLQAADTADSVAHGDAATSV